MVLARPAVGGSTLSPVGAWVIARDSNAALGVPHVDVNIGAMSEANDRHIRGYSGRTCPPLPPEDGRIRPASCTSIDAP
jgi:hypothetical protein